MVYKITLWLATGNSDLLGPISKFLFHHRSLLVCHSRPRLHEGKLRRKSMFYKALNGPPLRGGDGYFVQFIF